MWNSTTPWQINQPPSLISNPFELVRKIRPVTLLSHNHPRFNRNQQATGGKWGPASLTCSDGTPPGGRRTPGRSSPAAAGRKATERGAPPSTGGGGCWARVLVRRRWCGWRALQYFFCSRLVEWSKGLSGNGNVPGRSSKASWAPFPITGRDWMIAIQFRMGST
jgi:hypothetical protein